MPSFTGGLRPGDRVKVISGYFKDRQGIVKTCDADGRAVVEIVEGDGAFKARFTASQITRDEERLSDPEPASNGASE